MLFILILTLTALATSFSVDLWTDPDFRGFIDHLELLSNDECRDLPRDHQASSGRINEGPDLWCALYDGFGCSGSDFWFNGELSTFAPQGWDNRACSIRCTYEGSSSKVVEGKKVAIPFGEAAKVGGMDQRSAVAVGGAPERKPLEKRSFPYLNKFNKPKPSGPSSVDPAPVSKAVFSGETLLRHRLMGR